MTLFKWTFFYVYSHQKVVLFSPAQRSHRVKIGINIRLQSKVGKRPWGSSLDHSMKKKNYYTHAIKTHTFWSYAMYNLFNSSLYICVSTWNAVSFIKFVAFFCSALWITNFFSSFYKLTIEITKTNLCRLQFEVVFFSDILMIFFLTFK